VSSHAGAVNPVSGDLVEFTTDARPDIRVASITVAPIDTPTSHNSHCARPARPSPIRGRWPCSTTSAKIDVHAANNSSNKNCREEIQFVEPSRAVDEVLDDIERINANANKPTSPEDEK
jgi:hypothetical protein